MNIASKIVAGFITLIILFFLIYLTIYNWSDEMIQNLIAEGWGVITEVIILGGLLAIYRQYNNHKNNKNILVKIIDKHSSILNFIEDQKAFDKDRFLALFVWAKNTRKDCNKILDNRSIFSHKYYKSIVKYSKLLDIIIDVIRTKSIELNIIDELNVNMKELEKLIYKKSSTLWDKKTITELEQYIKDFKRTGC